jgi:hypothetical protein
MLNYIHGETDTGHRVDLSTVAGLESGRPKPRLRSHTQPGPLISMAFLLCAKHLCLTVLSIGRSIKSW